MGQGIQKMEMNHSKILFEITNMKDEINTL